VAAWPPMADGGIVPRQWARLHPSLGNNINICLGLGGVGFLGEGRSRAPCALGVNLTLASQNENCCNVHQICAGLFAGDGVATRTMTNADIVVYGDGLGQVR
jgi:hypothetical protein